MDNSEELEYFLYEVVYEISKENVPIIFKGGLALKDILNTLEPKNNIVRKTIDIDGNWVGKNDYNLITNVIEKAISNINSSYKLVLFRYPDKNKSLGYKILDKNGKLITKIDLDIKENPFYIELTINDVNVKYSSLEKIFADKLFVLSSQFIFRRIKDLLDVYLILNNTNINIEKVKEILKFDNKKLDNFHTLLENKDVIEQGYLKLEGVIKKPLFSDVWNKVIDYLKENHLV